MLIINFLKSIKREILVHGAGAAFFCLEPEPEPTQFGRSRLRDLGLSGAGAAQKKWQLRNTDIYKLPVQYYY